MYTEQQLKPYIKDLEKMTFDESLIHYIEKNKHTENFEALVEYCCNIFLDEIQRMFLKYDKYFEEYKNKQPRETNFIKLYLRATEFLDKDKFPYYFAVAEFYRGNKKHTIEYLKKDYLSMDSNESEVSVWNFVSSFVAPFKEAFDGFWEDVYKILSSIPTEKGVLELCKAMPLFYNSTNALESCAALEEVLTLAPDSSFVKEILAINYYNANMWGNAVALFEQIDETPILLFIDSMYFMMAWCYGKLKEISSEIEAYIKSTDIFPESPYAMNNLGYAYYKAKQYNKALNCFQRCIDNKWNLDTAVNNYVRTLLAMKRFKDAKSFAKNPPHKINKHLLEKVKNAENTNKHISADKPIIEPLHEEADAIVESDVSIGVKKQQFTSEKILEDELMLRIESGMEVFGKKLKIYRRKGIFGRQYILSNGRRPDLLAEDSEGNLYVIELKKDSGYDDAYEQTVDYLKWFDENWKGKVNNIYGIICLNDPTQALLDKVHNNPRIRVFEYQISYTER
ncbi:MAG: tetratricopeptide repeat protein [Ruminiclostridium sp.]|nr:tetratricopeptide repeat protein [Ruminiclostridium sp.]